MVGYSDSAKEVGMLAANLELYGAQRVHGRLGSRSRSCGSRSSTGEEARWAAAAGRRAGRSRPNRPAPSAGRFKVTEQGEVAFARYGNAPLARRHLEQMTNAVIRAERRRAAEATMTPPTAFATEIETMSTASRAHYEALVRPRASWSSSGVSPRSRRSARSRSRHVRSRAAWMTRRTLDDLRAIPWVFAWSQSSMNLTGWYGLGAGLDGGRARRGGLRRLRSMAEGWPFFSTLLENAELSLAKADLAIAEPYLARGDRPDLVAAIREELGATTEMVLRVTGTNDLLDAQAGAAAGDRVPQPLRRRAVVPAGAVPGRAGGARTERLIQATISGVAAGLQNTG